MSDGLTHAEIMEATEEYIRKREAERRENPTGDPRDHHRLGYGWHGPTVDQCPECGTDTVRKNHRGKYSVRVGYACPRCKPLRKRLFRALRSLVP